MPFSPKSPTEQDYFGVDWADELGSSETISTKEVTVSLHKGRGKDSNPGAIISGSSTHSGTVQSQLIVGGVRGVTYVTHWKITTSLGRTLEEPVLLLVR